MREALDDESLIAEDVIDTIDAMLSKLDQKPTEQLNEVIHNDEFQSWNRPGRGWPIRSTTPRPTPRCGSR